MLRKEQRKLATPACMGRLRAVRSAPQDPVDFEPKADGEYLKGRYSEPKGTQASKSKPGPFGFVALPSELINPRRERAFLRARRLRVLILQRRLWLSRKSATTGLRWASQGRCRRPSPVPPNRCRCCLG